MSAGTAGEPGVGTMGGFNVPVQRVALTAPVLTVARSLLGARLVHDAPGEGRVVVRLTEVEAYAGSDDPGSHAFRGRTPRTAVMFGPAGHAYVYLSYGLHWCLNVVTGEEGTASGVLVRAGEVIEGADLARARRPAASKDHELARGPARLTAALGVGRSHGGVDLCDAAGSLRLLPPVSIRAGAGAGAGDHAVASGPRVGVSGPGGSADYPWRLWLRDDPTVSAYRRSAAVASSGRLAR